MGAKHGAHPVGCHGGSVVTPGQGRVCGRRSRRQRHPLRCGTGDAGPRGGRAGLGMVRAHVCDNIVCGMPRAANTQLVGAIVRLLLYA